MTHDSAPIQEPPLDASGTPSNPDELVGPDGPNGPAEEGAGAQGPDKSDEGNSAGSGAPVPSADTGPDGPAPSENGAAGEAAAAMPTHSDTGSEARDESAKDQARPTDIDPADNPSNPDLVGHDRSEEDPTLAEPTA